MNKVVQKQCGRYTRLYCLYHWNRNLPEDEGTDKPVTELQKYLMVLPTIVLTSTGEGRIDSENTLDLSKPPPYPTPDTNVSLTAKLI